MLQPVLKPRSLVSFFTVAWHQSLIQAGCQRGLLIIFFALSSSFYYSLPKLLPYLRGFLLPDHSLRHFSLSLPFCSTNILAPTLDKTFPTRPAFCIGLSACWKPCTLTRDWYRNICDTGIYSMRIASALDKVMEAYLRVMVTLSFPDWPFSPDICPCVLGMGLAAELYWIVCFLGHTKTYWVSNWVRLVQQIFSIWSWNQKLQLYNVVSKINSAMYIQLTIKDNNTVIDVFSEPEWRQQSDKTCLNTEHQLSYSILELKHVANGRRFGIEVLNQNFPSSSWLTLDDDNLLIHGGQFERANMLSKHMISCNCLGRKRVLGAIVECLG